MSGNSPGMAGGQEGSLKPQSRRVGSPEPLGRPAFLPTPRRGLSPQGWTAAFGPYQLPVPC